METAKAHIQFQLDNLMSYDLGCEGVAEGRLNIHGWLYDMEAGALSSHDRDSGEWRGLLGMAGA